LHEAKVSLNSTEALSFSFFSFLTFPTSGKAEAVKGKRKKYCSPIMTKEPTEKQIILSFSRLYEFSAILFPP